MLFIHVLLHYLGKIIYLLVDKINHEEGDETVCIKCGDIARPGKQLDQIRGRKGTKSVNNSLDTLIGYAEKLNLPSLAESLQKNKN